jgi:hypothetical protein
MHEKLQQVAQRLRELGAFSVVEDGESLIVRVGYSGSWLFYVRMAEDGEGLVFTDSQGVESHAGFEQGMNYLAYGFLGIG